MTPRVEPANGHRIVIVGGGAGGLELACRLGRRARKRGANVVLVDRNTAHLWKPRLHEVAAGLTGAGDDQVGYLSLAHSHGFEFCWGELTGWSGERRTITVAGINSADTGDDLFDRRTISYDTLVLAIGSRVHDFGIQGVRQYCHMLDGAAEAFRLQRSFLESALKASAGKLDRVRIGIVGAGATGVELAAELHHAVHAMKQYGALENDRLEITLIDQSLRILPAVDARTSSAAHESLTKLGVKIVLGQGVREATKDGFRLANGEALSCDIMVWASGISGHAVAGSLGLPLSKGNRVVVDGNLACVGVPDVYAIGDCAAAPANDGKAIVPPTAQVAHQQAAYLAKAIDQRLLGQSYPAFSYRPRGTLVSLGAHEAAAEFVVPMRRSLPAHGTIAKFLYVLLLHAHRATLHGLPRAIALFASDQLRRSAFPVVKLH